MKQRRYEEMTDEEREEYEIEQAKQSGPYYRLTNAGQERYSVLLNTGKNDAFKGERALFEQLSQHPLRGPYQPINDVERLQELIGEGLVEDITEACHRELITLIRMSHIELAS